MLFYLVDGPLVLGACRLHMSLQVSTALNLQMFGARALMHQNGLLTRDVAAFPFSYMDTNPEKRSRKEVQLPAAA
jgi:hypothetical protein